MKDFAPVLDNISRHVELSNDEEVLLTGFMQLKKVRKRQFIVQPGFVCTHKSFVVKGALRAYFIDNQDKQHTQAFAIEDWWISDFSSMINQEPATLFVEALEDSILIQIAHTDMLHVLNEIPKLEKFERIVAHRALASQQKRLLATFTKTAEERYDDFMNRHSAIANRVPQYALASYLGFSTEYLSKIRNRKSSGN